MNRSIHVNPAFSPLPQLLALIDGSLEKSSATFHVALPRCASAYFTLLQFRGPIHQILKVTFNFLQSDTYRLSVVGFSMTYLKRIFSLVPLFMAFNISIRFSTEYAFAEESTSIADSKDMLNASPVELIKSVNFKIPPRPTGQVLDTALFLTPEMKQSLETALSQEARENGIYIYVLTVPSLEKNTIDPFTSQIAEAWTKGLFGAVIVFDDGTGLVSIQLSDIVGNRFYDFEISNLLRDSMNLKKRPRLSRAGLEYTAISVKNVLHELKTRADQKDHGSLWRKAGLGIVGLIGVLLGMFEYFRHRPTMQTVDEDKTSTTPP